METKICIYCNEELSLDQFPKHIAHKDNLDSRCFKCKAAIQKHIYNLKKQYPKPEPGPCPICNEYVTKWTLDHCHDTGKFRAYICTACNLGLGKFKDNIEILKKALSYLTTYETIN